MSVVFERQLNNIKEGLQAINQMKVSMKSLEGSDSNLMREGISQIQEANQKLNITQQTLSIIKNKAKNSVVFKNSIKSAKTLITQLKVLKNLLGDLYTKTKAIVFGGLAFITGGFSKTATLTSSMKNKASEGKGLGLNLAQIKALERTGDLKTGDESFYKNAFKSIKDNATSEGSANFATLGLNYSDFANMNDPTLMFKEFNKIALKLSKMKAQDKEPLEESFKAITGLSSSEFYKQGAFTTYNEQYKEVKKSGLDKIASAGESFDSMIMQFQTTMYAIVSKLAPFIKDISNAFTKGLKSLLNNKEFREILDSFGDAMAKIGKFLSKAIISFFENLPSYIKYVKDFINDAINLIKKCIDGIKKVFKSIYIYFLDIASYVSSSAKDALKNMAQEGFKELINNGNFTIGDLRKIQDIVELKKLNKTELIEILKNKYTNINNNEAENIIDKLIKYAKTPKQDEYLYESDLKQTLKNLNSKSLNATINIHNTDGSVTQTTQQITIPQGR